MRSSLFAILILVTRGALAAPPSPSVVQEAKAHVSLGEIHFDNHRYELAIVEFEMANQLAPRPVLLFYLGRAHEELGHKPEGLNLFLKYLVRDPRGPFAVEAAERSARLQHEMEAARAEQGKKAVLEEAKGAEQKQSAPPPPTTTTEKWRPKVDIRPSGVPTSNRSRTEDTSPHVVAPLDRSASAIEKNTADGKHNGPPVQNERRPNEITGAPAPGLERAISPGTTFAGDRGHTRRLVGIGLLAGGVAIAAGGGAGLQLAVSSIDDGLNHQFDPNRLSLRNALQATSFAAYGVGAALVATGIALIVRGAQKDSRPALAAKLHLAPALSSTLVGISIQGEF